MNVLETLTKLFSAKSITEIENGGELLLHVFHKKSYQELTALTGYQDTYELVKATKLDIDSSLEGIRNQKEQVNACLRLLKEAVDDSKQDESGYCQRKVEVLCALIKRTFYHKKWRKSAKKDFDDKYHIIANWKYYFLSYTTRGAAETNSNFEKLIKSVYGESPRVAKRKKENYVAKIITRFIASSNLHGFFDEENLRCGDDIEHKIENHCQCCFAFLLQRKMSTC